jgi:ribose transport system permease protein
MAQIAVASAMAHGVPLTGAIAIALACALVVGAVNGWLVACLGVNSFIITLATATLVGGLVSLYTHDQVILQGVSQHLIDFGSGNLLGVPRVAWLVALVALLVAYGLGWTLQGRRLVSVGSNVRAARLVGMPVNRIMLASFVVAALLAGIAGALQVARTGTGNPQIGNAYTLAALSAAFLGASTIRPGRFNVVGTLVGVALRRLRRVQRQRADARGRGRLGRPGLHRHGPDRRRHPVDRSRPTARRPEDHLRTPGAR